MISTGHSNFVGIAKSRKWLWAGHVDKIGETINAHRIFLWKVSFEASNSKNEKLWGHC